MNVLHLTSHLNLGGISSYVVSLSTALTRRGHRVAVVSGGGELEPSLVAAGVAHWRSPLATSVEFSPQVWLATRALAERLKREPVDLLHAHTRVAQVAAARLSRWRRLPYVTTWHGFYRPNIGRRLWPCTGNRTIAISEPVHQHLIETFKVPVERIRLIQNGVDTDRFAQPPDAGQVETFRQRWDLHASGQVIGAIGRLASGRVKGFDLLLAALLLVRREIPGVRAMIVGDGPRRAALECETDRLGLRNMVRFTGAVQDTRVPLALMDVFVFPVRWPEGFGLSLVEAMAAGKPVVAARVGAVPDIVRHARDGWLVEPENPAPLAEGIVRLLKDRALAKALGGQAQTRARETFGLNRMVEQVEGVYRELVPDRNA